MSYIKPKLGDEFAFIGKDFIDGIAFFRVRDLNAVNVYVEWERQIDKSYWSTCLHIEEFNPDSHSFQPWWNTAKYSVVKVESEEHKLFLKLKHNG